MIEGNIETDRDDVTWWMLGELSKPDTSIVLDEDLGVDDYRFDPVSRTLYVGPEVFDYLAYGDDEDDDAIFSLN